MRKVSARTDATEPEDTVAARIRKAEAAIANLKANFAIWVKADLDLICVHYEAAAAATSPGLRATELESVRRIAHNIKGQGGTFGCDALSAAAGEIDALLKRRGDFSSVDEVRVLVEKLNAAFAFELA